jgi:CRISPR-associated exonuclease Cas4
MNSENDYMLLSGIQHFAFCRRQWALIHIEQQWADNYFTVDGSIMHDRTHDPFFTEKRGARIVSRALH